MRLCALLLATMAACGHERASVIGAKVSSGQGEAQEPVEGASGTMDCPGELFPQDLGKSDEDGDLRAQHIGAVPFTCAVTIAREGFQPFKAAMQDVCAARTSSGCQAVDLRVVLAPAPGKNAGGTK